MRWQPEYHKRRRFLLLFLLGILTALAGWFYTQHYLFTRSWIPAWSLPAAQQPTSDDWVAIELLTDELTAETTVVSIQVSYSLHSQPQKNLLIHLRSRLDLDVVDLGSDLSNVVGVEMVEVERGAGEFVVEVPLERRVLSRFPVGSQIIPFATLTDGGYPQIVADTALFHRPFAASALYIPDYHPVCAEAAELELLQAVAFTLPDNGQLSERDPYAQVVVQYDAAVPQADLLTITAGLANPHWEDVEEEWSTWAHSSSLSYRPFEGSENPTTLRLYSWFVTAETEARTADIVDENGLVVPAVAVICGDRHGRIQVVVDSVKGGEEIVFSGR